MTVQRRLAEGGFGLVDLVIESGSHREMVLKRCYLTRPESFNMANKEIKMLETFASPYTVKLLAADIQFGNIGVQEALILLEYCGNGHLLDRLNRQNGKPFPKAEIYRVFGQILLAIQPMHDHNPPVIHRDLKLENILFGEDENIRLCDFGSCCVGYTDIKSHEKKIATEEVLDKETTQMYRAPEMCDLYMRDQLTEKTDIWALGCIFFALCFLFHPFQDQGSLGILSGKVKMLNTNRDIEDSQKDLLLRMLDLDPEARPSVKEIFYYVRALAKSEPPLPLMLTDEAKVWKERRMESEKKRNMKGMKKVNTPILPNKIHTNKTLDPTSTAAKRLAMKRGNTLSTIGVPTTPSPPFSPLTENSACNSERKFDQRNSYADFDSSSHAAASNFGVDAQFVGNESFIETSSVPSTEFLPRHALIESSAKIDVCKLETGIESSLDDSYNSVNKSLIDIDFQFS